MPNDRTISFDPYDTSFNRPNWGEEGATFSFDKEGCLLVSVAQEKAVDSYNASFECTLTMSPVQAAQLRDWLNAQMPVSRSP